jgi:hypothetical protein
MLYVHLIDASVRTVVSIISWVIDCLHAAESSCVQDFLQVLIYTRMCCMI